MIENPTRTVVLDAEVKLNNVFTEEYSRENLFKFARSFNESKTFVEKITELRSYNPEMDNYGNLNHDLLHNDSMRAHSRINIIKFFKPGEILNTVLSQ